MTLNSWFRPNRMVLADSLVLWLNYRVSVLIHLQFCLVLGATQFLGQPIKCSLELLNKSLAKVVDDYCWTVGIWTLEQGPGEGIPQGLVDPRMKMYHRLYQFVPVIMLVTAITSYCPRLVWKHCDDHRIDHFVSITHGHPCESSAVSDKQVSLYKTYQTTNKRFALK